MSPFNKDNDLYIKISALIEESTIQDWKDQPKTNSNLASYLSFKIKKGKIK